MARYMLDTDICSCVMKRSNDALLKRLQKTSISDVCISVITKSELLFGVELSPRRQQDGVALSAFLRYVEVLDFPEAAAPHYAKIRAQIGANDLLIAAHARSLGLTLVTNNRASSDVFRTWPSRTGHSRAEGPHLPDGAAIRFFPQIPVHHNQFSWSRDHDCSRPPSQIPTSGVTASGSRLG